MTQEELIGQPAAEFRARAAQPKRRPRQPGYSGSLSHAFLPTDVGDDMEVAINDAFAQGEEEPDEQHKPPIS
jgi:hypothetical protein